MKNISKDINDKLASLGFSFADKQVILTLLSGEMMTIQQISQSLSLPRSTVQISCEDLFGRNILKVHLSGKRRMFYLDSPHSLGELKRSEEEKLSKLSATLSSIIPILESISAREKDTHPIIIKEYSGEDGYIESFYESLNQKKFGQIMIYAGENAKFTTARDKFKKFRADRVKKKIFSRMLQIKTSSSALEAKDAAAKFREVRFLDKSIYDPNISVLIWSGHVAITVLDKGLHTIVIGNKPVATYFEQIFNIVWSTASRK